MSCPDLLLNVLSLTGYVRTVCGGPELGPALLVDGMALTSSTTSTDQYLLWDTGLSLMTLRAAGTNLTIPSVSYRHLCIRSWV